MTATEQRQGPTELLASMKGGKLYEEAAKRGVSLSRFLEMEDPSDQYKDGTDAFTRLVRSAGIVTRSDRFGSYFADPMSAFDRTDESRALVPEWMARRWREVSYGARPQVRAPYLSTDTALNSGLRPYFDQPGVMPESQLTPAIPLSELVAITQPVTTDAVRATYLTRSAAQTRLVRVTEAADMPRAKLTTSERTTRLYKYGRVLEITYEAMRRLPIDEVALYIGLLAVQAEVDKVATVLDVLVNGDGNSGTAATNYNLTTLDTAAVAGTLTVKGWLAFKMKFANPYMITTALAQEAIALQMQLLNVGSANVPLVAVQALSGFGSFDPINPQLRDRVALGYTSDAPASTIVGWDRRFGIRRYTEIGSDIQEVQRWTTRQVETLALSEVEGYATLDPNAVKTLTVSA
jgi:hypothetical protein